MVLPELKSDIAVGAFSVCAVPDVNPDIVKESNDGTVSEAVDVTVHGVGVAAVELMEHDCAVLTRAETAMSPATAASLRNISGLQDDWVSVVARPRRCVAPERQYDTTIGRTCHVRELYVSPRPVSISLKFYDTRADT
jgi:hypothetical protein